MQNGSNRLTITFAIYLWAGLQEAIYIMFFLPDSRTFLYNCLWCLWEKLEPLNTICTMPSRPPRRIRQHPATEGGVLAMVAVCGLGTHGRWDGPAICNELEVGFGVASCKMCKIVQRQPGFWRIGTWDVTCQVAGQYTLTRGNGPESGGSVSYSGWSSGREAASCWSDDFQTNVSSWAAHVNTINTQIRQYISDIWRSFIIHTQYAKCANHIECQNEKYQKM